MSNYGSRRLGGQIGSVAQVGEEPITTQRSQLSRIDLSLVVMSAWWSH